MKSTDKHWDAIFAKHTESSLGWYETDLSKTFKLVNQIKDWSHSTLFISGAGTSALVDELLKEKGVELVLNDISAIALEKMKVRLLEQEILKQESKVSWLCQDIAQPITVSIPAVDIWIDRAVLHFLTEEKAIKGYFENLKLHVKGNGHVIFAEFSQVGAEQCAGLAVHQYSIKELTERLGESFTLLSYFDSIYINPRGQKRPYIYALYQKQNDESSF